ncbi:hypothetical protein HanIR_Chr01g0011771 [Helianthus annuus]|nr:hypothetical protein HanIR_Chr01g0011771 [Helianthus annuus]
MVFFWKKRPKAQKAEKKPKKKKRKPELSTTNKNCLTRARAFRSRRCGHA